MGLRGRNGLLEGLEAFLHLALLSAGQTEVNPGFFVLRLELHRLSEIVLRSGPLSTTVMAVAEVVEEIGILGMGLKQ